MADLSMGTRPTEKRAEAPADTRPPWAQLQSNRNWLGFWFMLPAAAFLILFLAYPLGLGVWLSFTDARIGRAGEFIGFENYGWLLGDFSEGWRFWEVGDSVFWLSVFNTLLYTIVASVIKVRHRALSRAAAEPAHALQGDHPRHRADPLHRADRALGDCLLVDLRHPVLDHHLDAAGRSGFIAEDYQINWLGDEHHGAGQR